MTDTSRDKRSDPKMIGLWKIGRTIGKGSSGRVRIARHTKTKQYAAVKIVSKDVLASLDSQFGISDDALPEDEAARILLSIEREIVLMKLIDHPNILKLYDVWETTSNLYLIMEYVEGGELFDYLCDKGRLTAQEALGHFQQIIAAVDYCHRFNIAHRDLKPENLLMDRDRNIKVADFGMAAWQKQPNAMLKTACGSPHYAAPEVIMGSAYNGRSSDIWSCGVILYALLAGRLPFDHADLGTLLSKVKHGQYDMPSDIDPLARDLISKMLVKDVKKRITMGGIMAHPYFTSGDPRSVVHKLPALNHMATPMKNTDDIDQDILDNLRVLWSGTSDEQIIRNLTSPAKTWEKAVYHLLVEYREKHLENYEPDDDESTGQRTRTPSASPSPNPSPGMVRTSSQSRNLGNSPAGPRPSPQSPGTAAKRLYSPPVSPLDLEMARNSPQSLPPDPPSKDLSVLQNDEELQQDFFQQVLDHLTAMESRAVPVEDVTSPTIGISPVSSTFSPPMGSPRLRGIAQPLAPPPTPMGSHFTAHGQPVPGQDSTVTGPYLPISAPVPQSGRHRPPPLVLVPPAEDDNYVLVENDVNEEENGSGLLSPISASNRSQSPTGSRVHVLTTRRSKLTRKKTNGSPRLTPTSPAFSDDSYFPPSPTSPSAPASPKRNLFGNLFKFKPAQYHLLSVSNLHVTRKECTRLLVGMGVRVTSELAPDGMEVLKCDLQEIRDPSGVMAVAKAVQFRVEVRKPSQAQYVAGYTIVLSLVQEKGALSSFRLVYNRLRREWELDAPRQVQVSKHGRRSVLHTPPPPGSPVLTPGGRYADVAWSR